jgi:hypothetical protein
VAADAPASRIPRQVRARKVLEDMLPSRDAIALAVAAGSRSIRTSHSSGRLSSRIRSTANPIPSSSSSGRRLVTYLGRPDSGQITAGPSLADGPEGADPEKRRSAHDDPGTVPVPVDGPAITGEFVLLDDPEHAPAGRRAGVAPADDRSRVPSRPGQADLQPVRAGRVSASWIKMKSVSSRSGRIRPSA